MSALASLKLAATTAAAASLRNCSTLLPLIFAPISAVSLRKVSASRTASLARSSRA